MKERELFLGERDDERRKNYWLQGEVLSFNIPLLLSRLRLLARSRSKVLRNSPLCPAYDMSKL